MKFCNILFTFSTYITKFLNRMFYEYNIKTRVITLTHPVYSNIPLFSMEKYKENKHKKVLQIGQQLRRLSSIYHLKSNTHEKIWLTGDKDLLLSEQKLLKETEFFHTTHTIKKDVTLYYTRTFEEYDDLLTKNIVFIDLFDAAANNTVLECIVRNTPIIVNKLEGVVEYLGLNYPLYFTHLHEVDALLEDTVKLHAAHDYLVAMDKTKFTIDYFNKQLFTCVYHLFS